jgi:pimeloyl-ACP methyl ester carboxylesterase
MKRVERSLAQFAAIPVLLVWGMRDPVLGPDVLQMWHRRIMQFLETHP